MKSSNDKIIDFWNLHLKQDSLDEFKHFIDLTNIWELITINGYSILHAAASNIIGKESNEKLDYVIDKFNKNLVKLNGIEIGSAKTALHYALEKN